jgi:hypothetical protein
MKCYRADFAQQRHNRTKLIRGEHGRNELAVGVGFDGKVEQ